MSNLKSRLGRHFVACATVAAATAGAANAGIVYSGIVNLTIPATTNGLYLNVVTGANNLPGGGSGGTVPGWDVNPWGSTGFGLFSSSGGGYLNLGANTFNLPGGTSIGFGGTFAGLATGTNNAQWNLGSSNNIVGFRFVSSENGGTTHYGWFRVAFGSVITDRTLVEYAYESVADAAITAGTIPAPGALALLGLGGLVGARRRRA